ncbi:hypothetical protein HELRODRAFT_166012 [Helobdella robusta]|uniref:Uncharacterized protein n=1 Tax=Helobdella robusta TaxID=6412 RepID=T1EXL2_HELRO|nr:hypothetical protein HELRODRAFT_166012 [Helobdella robusta]ESN90354.1 hypothetical protein HELRODRAFT_166012 [Helobdella robusta]
MNKRCWLVAIDPDRGIEGREVTRELSDIAYPQRFESELDQLSSYSDNSENNERNFRFRENEEREATKRRTGSGLKYIGVGKREGNRAGKSKERRQSGLKYIGLGK